MGVVIVEGKVAVLGGGEFGRPIVTDGKATSSSQITLEEDLFLPRDAL